MKNFNFTLTGTTPLLMHQDDVDWADEMDAWKNEAKKNKDVVSRAGDDRTPAYRWMGCLYNDGEVVAIPTEMLIRVMVEAGKSFSDSTGNNKRASMKRAAVTSMVVQGHAMPLLVGGKTLRMSDIVKLRNNNEFGDHRKFASAHGFSLYVRRATVGQSKHIRVRPKFDNWEILGTITSLHPQLQKASDIEEFLNVGGATVGLGDWRPSAPKVPGPYGRFVAKAVAA